MPELKHTFMSGRMNKDLDERLVPNGEYRDAQNVEVLTSDGSDMGTVQTCLGNSLISDLTPDDFSTCVGSVVDDKTNNIYYFIAGNPPTVQGEIIGEAAVHEISSDLVVEYNSVNNTTLPVIVDIYNVRTDITSNTGLTYTVTSTAGLRIGMEIDEPGIANVPAGVIVSSPIITAIPTSTTVVLSSYIQNIGITVNFTSGSSNDCCGPGGRVLNFHRNRLITGVNIIDDMLFWTDNYSEPKKVNITRGKEGSIPRLGICQACDFNHNTANPYTFNGVVIPGTTHTELVVDEETIKNYSTNGITLNPNPDSTPAAPLPPFGISEYIQEKHITVIKKSPLTPPRLEMYDRVNRFNPLTKLPNPIITKDSYDWHGSLDGGTTTALYPVGTTSIEANDPANGGTMAFFSPSADFRVDDVLLLTDDPNANHNTFSGDDVRIRLKVISSDSTAENPILVQSPSNGNLHVKILYIDSSISSGSAQWYIRLENETQSLYELKFPKFGYRYKYEDGEYSSFSPFSDIAFLPQKFDYHPKKGYNKGMTNGLKQLFIKDFIPPNIPLDVVEIDVLYKESDSPNIYTVRSFNDTDPEWNVNGTGSYKGYFEIKDDLIHAVVESNQLLRPWDNVPKKALGQEVTGNRLIYGNYLQNYNLISATDKQIKPKFKATTESDMIGFEEEVGDSPETSLKSMRTYQLGVVYKDVYGRETPVTTHPSGVVKLDASKAIFNNKFTVQTTTPPPIWADSFKYFIKEVSNEYYNLAMDRWYYAGDKNIWLSFPSEDRNKVDEETTIILKKTNISDTGSELSGFVPETPRYKILAIENEAPEFIKTIKTSMGKMNLDIQASPNQLDPGTTAAPGSAIANNVFPFEGFDQIQISKVAWEKSVFYSLQNDRNQSGYKNSDTNRNSSFMVRLGVPGTDAISKWYDITNVVFNMTSGTPGSVSSDPPKGYYTIKIDGIFKEDVLFATNLSGGTPNAITGIVADLEIEIGKKTVENKAQFDGRFFAKVESDVSIWKYVMGNATSYSSGINTLISGVATPANVTTWRVTDTKNLFFNAYNVDYDPTAPEGSRYLPSYGDVDSTGNLIAGEGITDEMHIRGKDDWVDLINDQSDGTAGCSHNNHVYAHGCPKRPRWYIDMEPTGGSGHLSSQGNHPGRGAELGVAAIDISWSGVHHQNVTGVTFQDVGEGFPEEQPFIDLLETVGRRFRFTNDPDQIVYTITAWSTHDCYTYTPFDGDSSNMMKRWRLTLDKPIGEGATTTAAYGTSGSHPWQPTNPYTSIQYNDPSTSGITGTVQSTQASQGATPQSGTPNITGAADEKTQTMIEFVEPYYSNDNEMPVNPAIWETEPKEDVGLDIYYEVGQAYPVNMCGNTEELYIQPGATVSMHQSNRSGTYFASGWIDTNTISNGSIQTTTHAPGTLTTILSSNHSSTSTTSFTHNGTQADINGQYNCYLAPPPPAPPNSSPWIHLSLPQAPVAVGMTVTDPGGNIPPSTTIQQISWIGSPSGPQILRLSNFVPCPTIPPGTILTFTSALPIPPTATTITTSVTSIIGCEGDIPNGSTQPSTLIEFNNDQVLNEGDILSFTNLDGTIVTATVAFDSLTNTSTGQNQISLNALVHGERQTLPYYNCYTYGNGVESNRIRDLFNAVTVDKGVKASTTLAEQYKEENRKSGLIFSGIYNSMNGINRLNQFIMAENITKDLNPSYGSIQKLHARDTDLITLCEDKVLKVLSNKDALYNADDTKNITATSNVLGNSIPFVGEYGISKNPESFASEAFRTYFTDRERSAVLRLSRDGLTPISDHGMKDWFADNLNSASKLIGSYDSRKSLYNITLEGYTPSIPQQTPPTDIVGDVIGGGVNVDYPPPPPELPPPPPPPPSPPSDSPQDVTGTSESSDSGGY